MKEAKEESWITEEWSCTYNTKDESLLCRRFIPWLISGILVVGAIGAVIGAIIGITVQVTGEQVR
jgi:hypothetical protein